MSTYPGTGATFDISSCTRDLESLLTVGYFSHPRPHFVQSFIVADVNFITLSVNGVIAFKSILTLNYIKLHTWLKHFISSLLTIVFVSNSIL